MAVSWSSRVLRCSIRPSLDVILECFEILSGTLGKLLLLGAGQLQPQLLGNLFRDLFLNREQIRELAIVLLPPNLAVLLGVDQLHVDRKSIAMLGDRAR